MVTAFFNAPPVFRSPGDCTRHRLHQRAITPSGSYATFVRGQMEGSGGPDGIVLPLTEVNGGEFGWETRYTLPMQFGADSGFRNLSVEVDTGSSDLVSSVPAPEVAISTILSVTVAVKRLEKNLLDVSSTNIPQWVTSATCSSEACLSGGQPTYDPLASSSAVATDVDFKVEYLRGEVGGQIWWDSVSAGGYEIAQQAFAIADTVEHEPLSEMFSGILGLALSANSVISSRISNVDADGPDGAPFTSNIFSLAGGAGSPARRFIGLSLSRPGSTRVPALLSLGMHPSQLPIESDISSSVQYSSVLAAPLSDASFWRSELRNLSVWVDGEEHQISLPPTASTQISSQYPTVLFDSGVPLILAPKPFTDAIYGAISIGPGADGRYYLPCSTPLNISLQIDSRNPMWLHPLDMSAQTGQTSCIGLLQSYHAIQPENSSEGSSTISGPIVNGEVVADIVLGTPFLRNVYMVMGMEYEDRDGNFPERRPTDDLSEGTPRLGLLPLTDPTSAAEEWWRVRVQGVGFADDPTVPIASKGSLSVGIQVLIGLLSFLAICLSLFGIRTLVVYRQMKRSKERLSYEDGGSEGYSMLGNDGSSSGDHGQRRLLGFQNSQWKRLSQNGDDVVNDPAELKDESRFSSDGVDLTRRPLLGVRVYEGFQDSKSRSSFSSDDSIKEEVGDGKQLAAVTIATRGTLSSKSSYSEASLTPHIPHSSTSKLHDLHPPPLSISGSRAQPLKFSQDPQQKPIYLTLPNLSPVSSIGSLEGFLTGRKSLSRHNTTSTTSALPSLHHIPEEENPPTSTPPTEVMVDCGVIPPRSSVISSFATDAISSSRTSSRQDTLSIPSTAHFRYGTPDSLHPLTIRAGNLSSNADSLPSISPVSITAESFNTFGEASPPAIGTPNSSCQSQTSHEPPPLSLIVSPMKDGLPHSQRTRQRPERPGGPRMGNIRGK